MSAELPPVRHGNHPALLGGFPLGKKTQRAYSPRLQPLAISDTSCPGLAIAVYLAAPLHDARPRPLSYLFLVVMIHRVTVVRVSGLMRACSCEQLSCEANTAISTATLMVSSEGEESSSSKWHSSTVCSSSMANAAR